MSKFSYDDLPWDVAEKLQILDLELNEGDITQKGYDKKRAQLLEPYQSLIQENSQLNNKASHNEETEPEITDNLEDLGPEPSAADVTDFLDFLPSPTHSPVDHQNKGAALMEQNHKNIVSSPTTTTMQLNDPTTNFNPPTLPPRQTPTMSYNRVEGYMQQQPQPPRPYVNNNNNFRPTNFNNKPPSFDPRMGPPRPPMYSYPGRPVMNGFRPPPPYHVSSPQLVYRPPQQQQQSMYPYRPSAPSQVAPSLSQQHSRSPSLDSKSDPYYNNYPRSINFDARSNFDLAQDTDSLPDWDKASMNWRPTVGRDVSIMPNRMHQSYSNNTGLSNVDASSVRRSQSSASVGRSRYRDSYMATTFKAIEPAPQPRLVTTTDQHFLADLAGRQMTPLKGRDIPFKLYDSDSKTLLTDFKSLGEVLRFRAAKIERLNEAFLLVDARGKEPISLTWDKLNARAEKIAQTIRNKGNLKPGDRVALIYRKSEVIEFIPALFGCFLAGVTAVPINAAEDLSELSFILTLANIYLILTTEHNHKAFLKDIQAKSVEFPPSILWWKTNDMGTWYPSKKVAEYPPIKAPEIAYIEYAKASNGELKGVTVTHASIMEQCAAFHAATTETKIDISENATVDVQPLKRSKDTVVSYFEPRQQVGLIISILHSVYAGNTTIFASGSIIDAPAVWIYVLSRYKATIALADYAALKKVTSYYQNNVKEVKSHSKKVTPDLSSLRYLLVDTNTIKPELNQYIADKLLRPLGNTDNPLEVLCPVLSLPEHGGKIVSMKDNLGPAVTEELFMHSELLSEDGKPVITSQSVLAPGGSRDVFSCLFDAVALKNNKVVVFSAGEEAMRAENMNVPGKVCIESFGFCMPNTDVAIVDPDTATLCPPDTFGEVWVSAPAIDGGFWGLPKHSESIFHARPIIVPADSLYPEMYNETFLRTGLAGTVIGGRLFILGSYEERIRQQRLGYDFGVEETYYANPLLDTIQKRVRIEMCTIFEILVKNQHLPVVVCESAASRTDLTRVASDIDEALIEFHGLRAYAIAFVRENGLPKQIVHGRKAIHPLMTKRSFLQGQLRIRAIKMDVDRTIFNLAENVDPSRELWLSNMGYDRAIRSGAIIPHPQRQHTGMEQVSSVMDDRTEFDVAKFTNIVDILQWRTSMHPDEEAFYVVGYSGSTLNTKSYSWRKLSYKSAAIASHLTKKGLKRNTKVLVAIPLSIDYILTIYACLAMGLIPVPFEPVEPQFQPQRVSEFVEELIEVLSDLKITAILTNNEGEDALKHNTVKAAIKQHHGFKMPEMVNVAKASKHHKLLGKESGFMVRPDWISQNRKSPNLILVQYASDGRRYYASFGHDTLLNQCRTQKMTCQLRYQRSIVTTGLGAYNGLGFLYTALCGVYVGCKTILIPTADFYTNPGCFFETLQRYKSKDVFLTNALVQFAMNRMNANESRNITLKGVQNMMIGNDTRPKPLLYQHMAVYFSRLRLDKESVNTVYSHVANPMITTRSYMLMEPIPLSVDPYWLRQGIVRAMSPEEERLGILLNDSGIVPSNTMVAIVNPETLTICPNNMIGEIWVASDSNVKTFDHLDDMGHAQQFEASIVGNDGSIRYMRTGDLGFLWNVRRRVDNRMMQPMLEEGQCLYVLGSMNETIIRNGLIHFPMDVELSIERCHSSIPSGGSVVFQLKDELVAVVSVKSNEEAVACVPLIVNAVLENHSFLIDIVVIVNPNHLSKSRFGEKARRKVMTQFAEKKLNALYVKRITNQHRGMNLPQYSQSQLSLSDANSVHDTMSVHTTSRGPSEFNVDFDRQSFSQQLVRQDTAGSKRISHSNTGSIPHTPI